MDPSYNVEVVYTAVFNLKIRAKNEEDAKDEAADLVLGMIPDPAEADNFGAEATHVEQRTPRAEKSDPVCYNETWEEYAQKLREGR